MSVEYEKIDKMMNFDFNNPTVNFFHVIENLDFNLVSKKAREGMLEAHFLLALFYYYGVHVSKDYALAFFHCKKSEKLNLQIILFTLAFFYYNGVGTPVNQTVAFDFAKRAADMGCDAAKSFLAEMYYFGKGCKCDYSLGVEYAQRCGRLGFDASMYILASAYYEGKGVKKDNEIAKLWAHRCMANGGANRSRARSIIDKILNDLEKSNALTKNYFGFVPANTYLAKGPKPAQDTLLEYARGEFPIADFDKNDQSNYALTLYLQAADLLKENFATNFNEAYDLLIKSAELNCPEAYLSLAGLIMHFSKGEFEIGRPESTVAKYVKIAAETGHPRACYVYAYFLDNGYGVEKNREEGLYFYFYAYSLGDIDAKVTWLGLSDFDKKLAKKIGRERMRATIAERLSPEELYLMGCKFLYDENEKDYEESLAYLKLAYEKGYRGAIKKLAECYHMLKDSENAKRYWKFSAENGDERARYEIGYFCLHKINEPNAFITFSTDEWIIGDWEFWLQPILSSGHIGAIYEYVLAKGRSINVNEVNEWVDTALALGSKEYYKIGVVLQMINQPDRAVEFFVAGASEDSLCAEKAGEICERKKEYEKAVEFYKKAYDLSKYGKERIKKSIDRLEENRCLNCNAYYSAVEKKSLFGTKKVCSICGKKIN